MSYTSAGEKKIPYRNVQTVAFRHYSVYEILLLCTLKHFSHGGFCVPHLTAVGHMSQPHEGDIGEIEVDLGGCMCNAARKIPTTGRPTGRRRRHSTFCYNFDSEYKSNFFNFKKFVFKD